MRSHGVAQTPSKQQMLKSEKYFNDWVVREAGVACRAGGEDTKQTKRNEIYEKAAIFRMFRYFSYVSYFSLLAWR
jgi:hypothetical protein